MTHWSRHESDLAAIYRFKARFSSFWGGIVSWLRPSSVKFKPIWAAIWRISCKIEEFSFRHQNPSMYVWAHAWGWGTRNWSGLKGRSWASSLLPFSQGLRPSVFPWYIVRPRTSYTCVCLRSQRITLSRRAHLVNFDLWLLWKSLVCCPTCQYEFTIDHSTGCGPGPILISLAHVSEHLLIW